MLVSSLGVSHIHTHPFTGVLLGVSFFLFFIQIFLKFIFFIFYSILFFHFYFLNFKFIYWFLSSSFYISCYFILFFYSSSLLISFQLSFSPLGLFLIWVCVLVISIDSKFVLEFIARVTVIMLVHSTCQKCIPVRAWLALFVVNEPTTFKGMRESVCWLASQAFSLSS